MASTHHTCAPHLLDDCVSHKLPVLNWSLQGHSRGAERTGFWIPELSLGLDGGISCRRRLHNVLVSHCHKDHACEVPFLALGRAGPLPRVYVPVECADLLRRTCALLDALDVCHEPEPSSTSPSQFITCVPVAAGDVFELPLGPVKIRVRVVHCVHTVPTVGYVLSSVTNRLKDEYRGQPGHAIAAARAAGYETTHAVETPQLAFLGDTTVEAFRGPDAAAILACRVVVVECTMLGLHADDGAFAHKNGHICWPDLQPIVAAHPHITWVLIHFSSRYTDFEVATTLQLTAGANVLLWLDSGVIKCASRDGTDERESK